MTNNPNQNKQEQPKPIFEPIIERSDDVSRFHSEIDNPVGPSYTGKPEGLYSDLPPEWSPSKSGEEDRK